MSKELIDSFAQAVRAIYKDDPSKEQAGIDAARSALETAIEALQARVAELEKVSQDDRACCVSLQKALLSEEAENDALAVELAALKNQEPVATLWRENNQKLYPGLLIDLTATGEALPTGVLHHLFAAPTTPVREPDWLLETTKELAKAIHRDNYPDVPQWEVLDDLPGVISQIDNMVCGMERKTPVREPLSYRDILRIYNEVGPEDGVPYRFAGAIEAAIKEQA